MVVFSGSGTDGPVPAAGLSVLERRVLEAVDDQETLLLLQGLIAEPSENPPGQEEGCAQFLESFLRHRGVDCSLVEVAPGRPNLYASVGDRGPTLVLGGHLDTVPAGDLWTIEPFAPVVGDGRVYGRGACDMKAGLASAAGALLAVKRSGLPLRGRLSLHAVVDEEVGSAGARKATAQRPGDWAIIAEPSSGEVLATGNGQLNVEIVFHGKAVHSSHPEDGRNAIHDAAAFISRVEDETRRLSRLPLPGIGPATYSVGLVSGGRGGSTVADLCALTLDRRVLPTENLDAAEEEVRALLGRLESARPGLSWELSRTVAFPPLSGKDNGQLEKVLKDALADLGQGVAGTRQGMRFATDAAWYEAAGCQAVVFGPGDIAVAHQPDEYVAVAEVKSTSRALALCALRLLG